MDSERSRRPRMSDTLGNAGSAGVLDENQFDRLARRITAAAAHRLAWLRRARTWQEELASWAPWVIRLGLAAGIAGAVLIARQPAEPGPGPDRLAEESTALESFLAVLTGSEPAEQVLATATWPIDGSWALTEESSQ